MIEVCVGAARLTLKVLLSGVGLAADDLIGRTLQERGAVGAKKIEAHVGVARVLRKGGNSRSERLRACATRMSFSSMVCSPLTRACLTRPVGAGAERVRSAGRSAQRAAAAVRVRARVGTEPVAYGDTCRRYRGATANNHKHTLTRRTVTGGVKPAARGRAVAQGCRAPRWYLRVREREGQRARETKRDNL